MNKWYILMGAAGTIVAAGAFYAVWRQSKDRVITLDQLIEQYSERVDRFILKELAQGGLVYVSGKTTFQLSEEKDSIRITSDYYFQNERREWVKKTTKELAPVRLVTADSLEKLIQQGALAFDIDPPAKASTVSAS